LDFRTEQYREQLAMEEKFTKRALDHLKAQNPDHDASAEKLVSLVPQEGVDKPFLFDLVFDSSALTKDGSSKIHRCEMTWIQTIIIISGAASSLDVGHGLGNSSICCEYCALTIVALFPHFPYG
jgi:hypothetical protein